MHYSKLKVLELRNFELSVESVQRIFSLCQELAELNISEWREGHILCKKSVQFICDNLSTKIEKLDISNQRNFGNDEIKTLLKRCNKLKELALDGMLLERWKECHKKLFQHLIFYIYLMRKLSKYARK